VANDHESTGEQIGKAILIGLAIVAVVAIIVVLADSHHGSPHGSAHHGGGGHIGGGPGFHGGFHHGAFHPVAGVLDVFGRAAIDVTLATSDWRDDASLPHSGDEAQMYVEMTLVDNRTGLALWHAHQQFPARLGSSADTARVMHTLLDLLPPHVAAVARP
jgi:hypothetical protein